MSVEPSRASPGRPIATAQGRKHAATTWRAAIGGFLLMASIAGYAQSGEVRVFAAGSLRTAMLELIQAYGDSGGQRVVASFGPSGLLRERIEMGEPADVLASADLGNPQALARSGRSAPPIVFVRNRLCALVAPNVDVAPDTLLDRMLDPRLKLGTSTPKADPSGDYAWMVFERIEQHGRRGAFKQLADKAQQLTGGPHSPPPAPGRNVYGDLVAQGRVDLFLTYCTNATAARKQHPDLRSVTVPAAVNVSADYGVVALQGAAAPAPRFVDFLLGPDGQAILARHGFAAG